MSTADTRPAVTGWGTVLARRHRGVAWAVLGVVALTALAFAASQIFGTGDRGPRSGLTADTRPLAIVVGGEALTVPANMIRTRPARHAGPADRIDLLLHWPGLEGYSEALADAFTENSPTAPLIFVSIAPRNSLLDSDDRLDAVYSRFFTGAAVAGPAGLVGRRLSDESGYRGEIVFFTPSGSLAFTARCLAAASPDLPATCLRDIKVGHTLSMLYRFNQAYLEDWRALDASTRGLAARLLAAE
jgi:hypothetical protein